MAKRKRKYGGPKYGFTKERLQAPREIRKLYPASKFIVKRSPGSRGATDFKVFRKLQNGAQGSCVAAIQVKASARVSGAKYDRRDVMRLRMSASHHSPRCTALFLLLERGESRWEHV